jgi:hypothetical protein
MNQLAFGAFHQFSRTLGVSFASDDIRDQETQGEPGKNPKFPMFINAYLISGVYMWRNGWMISF